MIRLDDKQRGVATGMALGGLVSLGVVVSGATLSAQVASSTRFAISLLLPATTLLVAIARLAKHRFFTPADIDGSGFGAATSRARLLQSLLQNTLEQLAFAIPVYLVALSGPNDRVQATVPGCATLFVLGRLLFFATYEHGARARALGFALTFYPTALLLLWQAWLLLSAVFG